MLFTDGKYILKDWPLNVEEVKDGQCLRIGKSIYFYTLGNVYLLFNSSNDFKALKNQGSYIELARLEEAKLVDIVIGVKDREILSDLTQQSLQLKFYFDATIPLEEIPGKQPFRFANGHAIYHRLGGPEIEMIFDTRGRFVLPRHIRYQRELTSSCVPVDIELEKVL